MRNSKVHSFLPSSAWTKQESKYAFIKIVSLHLLAGTSDGRRSKEIESIVEEIEDFNDDGHVMVLINRLLLLSG